MLHQQMNHGADGHRTAIAGAKTQGVKFTNVAQVHDLPVSPF
jgi:hypothetical protein